MAEGTGVLSKREAGDSRGADGMHPLPGGGERFILHPITLSLLSAVRVQARSLRSLSTPRREERMKRHLQ